MKVNPLLIVSVTFAVIAVILFSAVAVKNDFPIFTPSNQTSNPVNVTLDVGADDSRFLWNNDGLALIAQAFVLFAAAAAVLGLLKVAEEKQHA